MVQACREVELTVLRALAVGLRIPEEYFVQYHGKADNQLRLLHYPRYISSFSHSLSNFIRSVSVKKLQEDAIARIGAHSDFCSLTLLFQDNVGGLEVEDPHHPGTFRVSILDAPRDNLS